MQGDYTAEATCRALGRIRWICRVQRLKQLLVSTRLPITHLMAVPNTAVSEVLLNIPPDAPWFLRRLSTLRVNKLPLKSTLSPGQPPRRPYPLEAGMFTVLSTPILNNLGGNTVEGIYRS